MGRRNGGGTPATLALTRAGIAFTRHEYEHDPRVRSYGLEAAAALEVDPACVLKTLLATLAPAGGAGTRAVLVVGIVPVSAQLDLKSLARALGGSRAAMADVAVAERATGYVVGGISPFGQRRAHPAVVDSSALKHGTVYVSGGRRGLDLGVAPEDLVRAVGALAAPISRW